MRFFFIGWSRMVLYRFLLTAAGFFLFAGLVVWYYYGAEPVIYSDPIYQGSGGKKEITLTVNVFWGEEYIPQMLDILRRNDVKATFFLGGAWVKKNPELAARIADEGHEIGNHGYSHPHPDRLSVEANRQEIKKAEEIIFQATGVRTKLFAPPYGERGPAVLRAAWEESYTTTLWSLDTIDWQLPQPEVIVQRSAGRAHNGAVILMHPTAPTVKALPEIIESLHNKGYQLVTMTKLLESLDIAEDIGAGRKVRI